MKRIIIILCLISFVKGYAQAPHLINYQAIARDGSGNIITSGSIGLKFEILQGSTTGTVAYGETNTASPSAAGIFNVAIGGGTPFSGTLGGVNWATGPYFIRVSIDPTGGTSYTAVGTTQLMSVPYALYAEKAGNSTGSLPTGTLTGQTLYWDNSISQWVINKNLFNNGANVNVGDPIVSNNKMKVVSSLVTDSAALFVYKTNSSANQVAVRGIAAGSASNSGSLTINPIAGGHFVGYNINPAGSAVGVVGQGSSPLGDAVGLIGIASSSASSVGRSVGLYASSTGPYYPTSYAAIFDRGKVFVNDTLIINTPGGVGDVLTRGVNGKAQWSTPPTPMAGPWTQSVGSVTLTNANDNVYIGTNSGSAKLNIASTTGFSGNDISVASNSSVDALQIFKFSGTGSGLRIVNASTTNTSIATIAMFSGGNQIGLDINISSNNPALQAQTTGTSSAILGINSGSGPSVRGLKNTTGSGIAGLFDNNNPGNTSDALLASTVGSGAAVHALAGPTPASALALLVENGHIKAVGPSLAVSSTSVVGGFSAPSGATCTNCNDVRGIVSFSTGVTGFGSPNYAEVTVTFAKPYATIPFVSITPLTDMQDLGYVVANPTSTSFSIRVYRSSNKSVPLSVPSSLFKFNYLIIE